MSLRELASSTACPQPLASSSSSAVAAAANPLARLADALLPRSAANARTLSSAVASSSSQPPSTAAPPPPLSAGSFSSAVDPALLLADVVDPIASSTEDDLWQHHATLPPRSPPLLVDKPHALPLRGSPPPVPPADAGGPTDVFERAFLSAAAAVAHTPAVAHPAAPAVVPGHPALAPSPPRYQLHRPPVWPSLYTAHHEPLRAAFSRMALAAPAVPTAPAPSVVPSSAVTSAPAPVSQQTVLPPPVAAASAEMHSTLTTPESWGDEFTSFESAEAHHLFATDDRFLMDDSLQTAFQHWLRRETAEAYSFVTTRAVGEHDERKQRTAQQALDDGIQLRKEGRLSEAIACFESALDRSDADLGPPLSLTGCATAWYLLGLTLADVDDDRNAILALLACTKTHERAHVGARRHDNPFLYQALIALAVSYTNEFEPSKALRVLREWVMLRNAALAGDGEAGLAADLPKFDSYAIENSAEHKDILADLHDLAAQSPTDVDVLVVIAVVLNVNRDYEAAAVALRHAVALRPEDAALWNKLGATLANGGQGDDALRAYRKAVDLHPSLIRAWVNVGTAYANRNEGAKAVRYYLKAVSMANDQSFSTAPGSSSAFSRMQVNEERMVHVWDYIRSALVTMGRSDLGQHVEKRDVAALRAHFSF